MDENNEIIMVLEFNSDFDTKRKKGFEVEIDDFEYNPETLHILRVRVVNIWKRPTWMSANWFTEKPEKVQS